MELGQSCRSLTRVEANHAEMSRHSQNEIVVVHALSIIPQSRQCRDCIGKALLGRGKISSRQRGVPVYVRPGKINRRLVLISQPLEALVSHKGLADSALLKVKPYALEGHGCAKAAPV